MIRENVRRSTDDLLMARAVKLWEDRELAQQPQPLWRDDLVGVVLVMILATIVLVLAFAPSGDTVTKPDAFTLAVVELDPDCHGFLRSEVADLLRRHHAEIERLVRRMEREMANTLDASVGPRDDSWIGYQQACTDLLAALKEMRG